MNIDMNININIVLNIGINLNTKTIDLSFLWRILSTF